MGHKNQDTTHLAIPPIKLSIKSFTPKHRIYSDRENADHHPAQGLPTTWSKLSLAPLGYLIGPQAYLRRGWADVAVGDRVRRSVCLRCPKLCLQSCGSDYSVQYLTLPRGRPHLYFHLLRSWLPATSLHKHSPSLVLISDFRYPFRSLCFRIRVGIVIGSWLSLQLEKCVNMPSSLLQGHEFKSSADN